MELDKQKIRARLLALRQELDAIAETGYESAGVVELDQAKVGRLSRMEAMQAQAMAKATTARREAILLRIEAALARVDQGAFGYCLRCEETIHPKRLELDPTATLCIDCAALAESE